jgi:hypothetical protein
VRSKIRPPTRGSKTISASPSCNAVNDLGLAGMREYLESVWGEAAGRFRLFAENTTSPGKHS